MTEVTQVTLHKLLPWHVGNVLVVTIVNKLMLGTQFRVYAWCSGSHDLEVLMRSSHPTAADQDHWQTVTHETEITKIEY